MVTVPITYQHKSVGILEFEARVLNRSRISSNLRCYRVYLLAAGAEEGEKDSTAENCSK